MELSTAVSNYSASTPPATDADGAGNRTIRQRLAAALLFALVVVILQILFIRPHQDLPMFDDSNYFVAGHYLIEGRLDQALFAEWTPFIHYVTAAVWTPIWPQTPSLRFEIYRTLIHFLFAASLFLWVSYWFRSWMLIILCCLIVLAVGASGTEIGGWLRVGEIYLFSASCLLLILTWLFSRAPLSLLDLILLPFLTLLIRKEFVIVVVPAILGALIYRRRLGVPFFWSRKSDWTKLIVSVLLLAPIVIAGDQRDGFRRDLLGGRFTFAFEQKFCQYRARFEPPQPGAPADDAFVRAFNFKPGETRSFSKCWQRNPQAVREFVLHNVAEFFRNGLPVGSRPTSLLFTYLVLLGLGVFTVLAVVDRRWDRLFLVAGHIASVFPLFLTMLWPSYIIHVTTLAFIGLFMLALRSNKTAVVVPVLLALTFVYLQRPRPPASSTPRRDVAAFLLRASREFNPAGKVIAEPYPQFAKALAMPTLEFSQTIDTLKLRDDGVYEGSGGDGRTRVVDLAFVDSPQCFERIPKRPGGVRVIAQQGPLQLLDLRPVTATATQGSSTIK